MIDGIHVITWVGVYTQMDSHTHQSRPLDSTATQTHCYTHLNAVVSYMVRYIIFPFIIITSLFDLGRIYVVLTCPRDLGWRCMLSSGACSGPGNFQSKTTSLISVAFGSFL